MAWNWHCPICGTGIDTNGGRVQELECETCHTVFDFENRKVDRSRTVIAPMDCQHAATRLISGASGSGQNHTVTICLDCGELNVSGFTADLRDRFDLRIVSWNMESAMAFSKPAALVAFDEKKRKEFDDR